MSSMTSPSLGSSSLTSTPDLPDRVELEGRCEDALGDALGSQVDRLGPLAGELLECRLGVEEVHVRWAAGHEKKDDVFGGRVGANGRFAVTLRFFGRQQSGETHQAKTVAGRGEHLSAGGLELIEHG
ncbi:MAG: hypothetical protein CM1200mP2_26280 [Planctomycetaceae bacterium]|nr:MAG: hypothetical protein CM1200mP2_26280 [Planctomycetaceae bacterium]